MKQYFLTVRAHNVKQYVSEWELIKVFRELERRIDIQFSDTVYEMDHTYDQLHCHTIVQSNKSITYKSNSSISGFRLFWKPIKTILDRQRIISYIHKDCANEFDKEQILLTNYYRHHYGFI